MNMFQQFAAPVAAGMVFHLTLRKAGENMQLEIIPVNDANSTGIVIPPRALVATPQELDEQLPAFLQKYLVSAHALSDQMAASDQAMDEASTEVKKAAETQATSPAKSRTAVAVARPKTASVTKPKARDMSAGLMDDADDEDAAMTGATTQVTGETSGDMASLFSL